MSESWATNEDVRRSMLANKGRDTKPEIAVRRIIHARGLRYRVDEAPIRGLKRRADLVFRSLRIAVFIDGCFWHGCPIHYTAPVANGEFWKSKIEANGARDRNTDSTLEEAGWAVLRYWEHENPSDVADSIQGVVEQHRSRARHSD